jgi:hypothetical protein
MGKWLIFVLFFLATAMSVSADWIDLSATDTGNWMSSSAIFSVKAINDVVYTGTEDGKFGRFNSTTGVWTNLGNFGVYVASIEVVDNLVYLGLEQSQNFRVYNISDDTVYDLSSTDAGNWAGISFVSDVIFNPINNLIYTGLSDGKFGVYNASSNVWTDLSTTDAGDWVGNSDWVNSLSVDSFGNVYTGIDTGKLGIYNISSNVWTDLSTTDTAGWANSCFVWDTVIDSSNNVYTSCYQLGLFGVYNPNTNVWVDLSATDDGWVGSNGGIPLGYDSINDLIYTGIFATGNNFGVYIPLVNNWINLSDTDIGNWAGSKSFSGYHSIDVSNELVYTGLNGGGFGVYGNYTLPACIESWYSQYSAICDGVNSVRTLFYTDSNSCNTSVFLPIDNGTIYSCPLYSGFDGSTSNLSNINNSQLESFSGLILEVTSFGKVMWNGAVNISSVNFNSNILFNARNLFVNSGGLHSSINSSANVSLYNVSFINPIVLKNGVVCSDCVRNSFIGQILDFSVLGFSNYTLDENATPSISFVSPSDSGVINSNYLMVNASVLNTNLSSINISLYNTTSLFSSINGSFANFTGLLYGNYWYNATACNLYGVCNTGATVSVNYLPVSNDSVVPSIVFTDPTIVNGSVVEDRAYFDVRVVASDLNFASLSVFVFDGNRLVVQNFSTVLTVFSQRITVSANGVYYFNATACDSYSNCNSTELRVVSVLGVGYSEAIGATGGRSGGVLANCVSPYYWNGLSCVRQDVVSNAEVVVNLPSLDNVLNLEDNPVLSYNVSYVKDNVVSPASSHYAEILDSNGSVVKTVELSVLGSGVYGFSNDFSEFPKQTYTVRNVLDGSQGLITANVVAYPPMLSLIYDDGLLSVSKVVVVVILFCFITFLSVIGFSSLFKSK